MKMDYTRIEDEVNHVFYLIQELTINYIDCLDEKEEIPEYEKYLFNCHYVRDRVEFMHDFGIINFYLYNALMDVINALINRHIHNDDYISELSSHYKPFEI